MGGGVWSTKVKLCNTNVILTSKAAGCFESRIPIQYSSVAQSNSLWPHGLQHTRLPCPSPTPRTCSDSCPSNGWCHPTISSSVIPFSSCLQSFPISGSFPMSHFFTSHGQTIGVSASASVLPRILRTDLLWDWLVWSPCSPRDSQESSPTPQFKSINSSVLSLLYGPTLTSTHEKPCFDYTDLCQQSNVSAF